MARRLDRPGSAPGEPVLQLLERQVAHGFPYDQLAVHAGYHTCLINSSHPPADLRFPRDAECGDRGSDGSHERNIDHGCPQEVLVGVA
jgi:hypothetical protein